VAARLKDALKSRDVTRMDPRPVPGQAFLEDSSRQRCQRSTTIDKLWPLSCVFYECSCNCLLLVCVRNVLTFDLAAALSCGSGPSL